VKAMMEMIVQAAMGVEVMEKEEEKMAAYLLKILVRIPRDFNKK